MKTHLLSFVISLLCTISALSLFAQASPVATVRVDSVWGCPGEIVEVPVRVYGIEQLGLDAFTFELQIDTALLEPVLVTWDPVRNQGMPVISDWDPDLLGRGSMVAMNYFLGNGRSNLAITWIDGTFGQPKFKGEDGTIVFKLNLRIKKTLTVPAVIEVVISNMAYEAALNQNYSVTRTNGHVLAKSIPNVKIDNTDFQYPFIDAWNVQHSDLSMCVEQTLPLTVSGAQRYVWESYRPDGIGNHHFPGGQADRILDRTDVFNPAFTPIPAGLLTGWYNIYIWG